VTAVRLPCRVGAAAALALALAPAPTHAAGEKVVTTRLSGTPVEGPFASIDATHLRLTGHDPVPLAELLEARFEGPPSRAPRAGPRLAAVLRGGEEVVGTFVEGDAEGITLEPTDYPAVAVPFDAVLRLEARPATAAGPCASPSQRRPPRPGQDVVHARSGDAFAGTLLTATDDGVVIESGRDRRQTVPWAEVLVLHLDEEPLDAPESLVLEVDTAGGSRLVATSVEGDARGLRVKTRSGLSVALPLSAVRALRGSGGSFVYACDLPWKATYEHDYGAPGADPEASAAYVAAWFAARAHEMLGHEACPLRIDGKTYRHGFGVHARTVLTVTLGKRFRSFRATFGLDDTAKAPDGRGGGEVRARVLADGKEVWTSGGSVRVGEPARAVGPVSVEGVETLSLEVGWGEVLLLDRAVWADPVLVRAAR
jgi:hypothetical protein